MEKYNYLSHMTREIKDFISDHTEVKEKLKSLQTKEEKALYLETVLGSTDEAGEAKPDFVIEERLCHNLQLLAGLCRDTNTDMTNLVLSGAAACDAMIREGLLHNAVCEALEKADDGCKKGDRFFRSVGDVNFFEDGILIRKDTDCDTGYYIIRCCPISDQEDSFRFGELYVDIADDWIDKSAVTSLSGTDGFEDPEDYAIACTDCYSWDNFGAESAASHSCPYYDWTCASRDQVQDVLASYRDADMFPKEAWVDRMFEGFKAIRFISYDGKYPNLCRGTLVLEKDGKQYQLQRCLRSGGSVYLDEQYNATVTTGSWMVVNLPKELEPFHDEIEQLVNDNVEHGCCGGCV